MCSPRPISSCGDDPVRGQFHCERSSAGRPTSRDFGSNQAHSFSAVFLRLRLASWPRRARRCEARPYSELTACCARDGAFYHVDTDMAVGESRKRREPEPDRVPSSAFDLYAEPKGFSGVSQAFSPWLSTSEYIEYRPAEQQLGGVPFLGAS